MDNDYLIKKAFSLAKKGRNLTGLNPMVGALIIKSGKIIGAGFHSQYGGPHAEVNAILDAESKGFKVMGSTLICSLEPCCHNNKKTPPCTDLIIKKGIKNLYYGALDLNPFVKGKGIEKLKNNNIKTTFIDYQQTNDELNRGSITVLTKKRPYVTLKICMTLDGMIYNQKTKNNSIGDSNQLKHANNLRRVHDSVLVGVETIIKDNPKLTFRGRGSKNFVQPRPVILDSNLRIPLDSHVIKFGNNPIIFTKKNKNSIKYRKLISLGCSVVSLQSLKPQLVLKNLVKNNLQATLIEGGARIFSSFLTTNMFDELVLYYSSNFMGTSGLNIGRSINKDYKIRNKMQLVKNIGNSVMMVFK